MRNKKYTAIKRLKKKDVKSFLVLEHLGFRGVYIGVASDKIVANPGTITGSIGVIIRGNNLSELLNKIGIKFETVKSGVFKDILSQINRLVWKVENYFKGL